MEDAVGITEVGCYAYLCPPSLHYRLSKSYIQHTILYRMMAMVVSFRQVTACSVEFASLRLRSILQFGDRRLLNKAIAGEAHIQRDMLRLVSIC